MSVIVTDTGFASDDWDQGFEGDFVLDLASDTDPTTLKDKLDGIQMIRVDFPTSADGRGFTIARHLRLVGYTGRLRAKGHILADQYAMARRVGFDEVEISDELAERQPQDQWQFRANWQSHNYQARMRAATNRA